MEINADTKIAKLLKANPDALEAIVSLSPRFIKLRNPFLRNIIAARTSIRTAAGIGNCTVEEFYNKLTALGFTIHDSETKAAIPAPQHLKPIPLFLKNLGESQCVILDVRPIIDAGKDPLQSIMQTVKNLAPGKVLKLINSFEPTPLIALLQKKGFQSYIETHADDEIYTYFYGANNSSTDFSAEMKLDQTDDFDTLLLQFGSRIKTIDVRALEMPGPMETILQTLDELDPQTALFVHHKRVPVFLLPELQDRGFEYRVKIIQEGQVVLFIFKL